MRQKRKVVYDSVYKCDRCGKEFNYMIGSLKLNKALLNYSLWSSNRYMLNGVCCRDIKRHYDLCSNCSRAVHEFIRKGKITI
jgi:DNA-directed RNA polymerase subunit RPC12/RpoP